jgi:hypothetical protein
MVHPTFKMIVCQNFNLSHTYSYHHEKTHLWYDNYQTFFHSSKTYYNHIESKYLINTTNFIKITNHFIHFLNTFAFFNIVWHTFILHKLL